MSNLTCPELACVAGMSIGTCIKNIQKDKSNAWITFYIEIAHTLGYNLVLEKFADVKHEITDPVFREKLKKWKQNVSNYARKKRGKPPIDFSIERVKVKKSRDNKPGKGFFSPKEQVEIIQKQADFLRVDGEIH